MSKVSRKRKEIDIISTPTPQKRTRLSRTKELVDVVRTPTPTKQKIEVLHTPTPTKHEEQRKEIDIVGTPTPIKAPVSKGRKTKVVKETKPLESKTKKAKENLEPKPLKVPKEPKVKPVPKAPKVPKEPKVAKESKVVKAKEPKKPKEPKEPKMKVAKKIKNEEENIANETKEDKVNEPKKVAKKNKKESNNAPAIEIQIPIKHRFESLEPGSTTSLPCREKEFEEIKENIQNCLNTNIGNCLYVSGVPGSGKSATINNVVNFLKSQNNDFDFIEINGTKLKSPNETYSKLHELLSGKKVPISQSVIELRKIFSETDRSKFCIVLIEEVDMILANKQKSAKDLFYNILDWTTQENSKLIAIIIANQMNLPETFLSKRVVSRLGFSRVIFEPYNHQQLKEILLKKLENSQNFNEQAIELAARKVSAVTGDIRKSFDICRKAADIAKDANKTEISLYEVHKAIEEMYNANIINLIHHLSLHQKIILYSASLQTEGDTKSTTPTKISLKYILECNLKGWIPIHQGIINQLMNKLCQLGLLKIENNQVTLPFQADVEHAYSEDKDYPK